MNDTTFPPNLRPVMAKAVTLEWWNVGLSLSTVAVIGLVLGQSQTMKTVWLEDMLALIPPIVFLISAHFELRRGRSRRFPFGFERGNSLGFFIAAAALTGVGLQLLIDASFKLFSAEHPTIGSVTFFGQDIWLGWLMLGAQFYALIPPFIIGRLELPLAEQLSDKLLHTDALMNKASWHGGAAGCAGIIGLGLGYWWADAAAAAFISVGIIYDGVIAFRVATAELIDGAPCALSGHGLAKDALELQESLEKRFPNAEVRLRETGRVIRAEIHGAAPPHRPVDRAELWPGDPARAWRLAQISFIREPEPSSADGDQEQRESSRKRQPKKE
ncbi:MULTISPECIES: cation transporter [unclassified Sphingomonas]|uniref:cation transporter n=1 Tax=unclassified Sphingomonas TaxID=196159 RepID=UPI001AC6D851|nr:MULTISPECIES: cation transporter [unclassified Sphingomonas]MBN8850110.1 cation transporter [Sphingomonas sp.]